MARREIVVEPPSRHCGARSIRRSPMAKIASIWQIFWIALAGWMTACTATPPAEETASAVTSDDPWGGPDPQALGDPLFDWPLAGVQQGELVPGWNTRVQQNYNNRGGSGWYSDRAHTAADITLP